MLSDVGHYLRIGQFCFYFLCSWGTGWCIWLRHCYTSRKVAGFHWWNPSGNTIALRSVQPLT